MKGFPHFLNYLPAVYKIRHNGCLQESQLNVNFVKIVPMKGVLYVQATIQFCPYFTLLNLKENRYKLPAYVNF
jgi:hypothetical protein